MQNVNSAGPACRTGLRGRAAISEESRSKGRPRGAVERMCDPWRFGLRRKSFPAERTYQSQSFPAERTYQSQSFPAERTYFNNHPRRYPARQINEKLPRSSRFPRTQNAKLLNSSKVARTPDHSATSKKGEIMQFIDSLDDDLTDCPEPLVVHCTIPIRADSRLTSTSLDDDFLCWSSRQKDAEIVVEYDV